MSEEANPEGVPEAIAAALQELEAQFQIDATKAVFSAIVTNRFHVQMEAANKAATLVLGSAAVIGVGEGQGQTAETVCVIHGAYRVDFDLLRNLRRVIGELLPDEMGGVGNG